MNPLGIIQQIDYKKGYKGDVLFIDMAQLREKYKYVGLWYARDKTENISLTTELYYGSKDNKPVEFNQEIKENTFKQIKRIEIPRQYDSVWIGVRIDSSEYCSLKVFDLHKEHTYVNYKVINNRDFGIETLGNGIIKGGAAHFHMIGVEDRTGEIDYKDTILFLVGIEELPPEDWRFDHNSFGVQRLPVFVQSFNFDVKKKYSPWFEQDPLGDIQ